VEIIMNLACSGGMFIRYNELFFLVKKMYNELN
jgi:hypothetical protein